VLVVLWARFAPVLHGWRRAALHAWFLLIAASVLTTYQHHVLDVPAGALLGLGAIWFTRGGGGRTAPSSAWPA
jgi:membrane-associated phospholipid phosphatase